MASFDELQLEAEWRRCRDDEVYFLETYWHIRHPEHGRILLKLRDAQRETLERWNSERYTITLKARQIGFSTLAGGHAVWLAFFHPDRFIVMLSKSEREAAKLLLKSKYGFKFLPGWMLERGPKLLDNNMSKMSWDNDSAIESLPSNNDPARGESVYLVIVDEWAFLPNPEEAWSSIEPITDIGGRIIGISTANGWGNFFHTFYVDAATGVNQFTPIFFPWSAADERDAAWYANKKRAMSATPWTLHQEYPNNDVECFIKSGMSVFDTDELQRMETEPPLERGQLVGSERHPKASKVVPDDMGPLRIWERPHKDGRRYVIGADVAEGLEHGDYSSAHVIDTKTGKVVAVWHGHTPADLFGSEVLWLLGWMYGCALIGVEVNNMGIATCLALQSAHYPNLYYRTTLDERSRKQSRKVGWRTTQPTKLLMVGQLAAGLRLDEDLNEDGESVWSPGELIVLDSETIAELSQFVREPDGKTMHGSPRDDRVISLAIANQMRGFAFSTEWQNESTDPWAIGGWLAFAESQQAPTMSFIGAHNGRRQQ